MAALPFGGPGNRVSGLNSRVTRERRKASGRASMGAWQHAACALFCLALASCAGAPLGVDNTDLFESVRNADLSARDGKRVRQTGSLDPKASTQFEFYPGKEDAGAVRSRPLAGGQGVQQRQTPRGEGYELNFENANLSDVVKVILGDTLKEPYIYDPRIQAQVTLSTGRAVSKTELLHVLEAILALNNASLVGGSGGYKIVPVGETGQADVGSIRLARAGDSIPPGQGISVLPLYYVSAESMLQVLDSFIARAGSLKADAVRNVLLVRGSAAERQSLVDVAMSFDVDWLRDQSAGIFPLQHATPEEIITEVTKLLQTGETGTATASTVRLQPIARLNAVLVVTKKPQQLKDVAAWVKRLDRSNSAGLNTFVYKVENGKAVDIAAVLSDTFGLTRGASTQRRGAQSEVAPGQGVVNLKGQGTSSGLRGGTDGRSTSGQGGTSGSGLAKLERPAIQRPGASGQQPGQTPQGPADPAAGNKSEMRIIADEVNNSLLIRATAPDYEKILTVLRQIDRPALQVLINATIAEVTLNDQLRYGVQVFVRGKGGNTGGGYFNGPDFKLSPKLPGLNFFVGSQDNPQVMLDALAKVTDVRVVSSPSLVVVDNQPAVLQVGDEVPVTTQQATNVGTTDPLNTIVSNVQYKDTGVILKVTPRVNSNGLVTMDVEQEVSNVIGGTDSGTLTPSISQRRIASTISVMSGQTVALGGLISERQTREKGRVPLLDKVPLIGDLVGSTNKERARTELIVFIRPEVIRNSQDAATVAEELRAKVKLFAPEPSPRKTRWWEAETVKAGK